jgi:hypothetical protein
MELLEQVSYLGVGGSILVAEIVQYSSGSGVFVYAYL